jgi:regulation of enolase protein 1 (concanavalin A-like superfamily)
MIRQTLDATSAHALTVMSASSGAAFQYRATAGGSTAQTWSSMVSAPYWLKLTRSGNVFTSYVSNDGATWTYAGAQNIAMTASVYVGLAVSSHNASLVNTSTFTDVRVSNASTTTPLWAHQDVGSVGVAGNTVSNNCVYTLTGSGADIWNTADGFHFMYQRWIGDGTIIAQVASLQNTDPWAKAGVMFRETLNANSTHASSFITVANGAAFQRRLVTGGYSAHLAGSSVAAPYWVKLTRAGNVFSSYISTDGTTWMSVGSDTVSMASNVYVGLAVTAHNNAVLNTATFGHVQVGAGL